MLRLSFLFGIFLCFFSITATCSQVDYIVIEGSVDGQVGNLILDTGISKMLLNKRYAESTNLFSNKEFNGVQSVNGGMSLISLAIQEFSAKIGADVLDLKPIERQKGITLVVLHCFQIQRV